MNDEVHRLYRDAKEAIHETLTTLPVSYTLCRCRIVEGKRATSGPCPQSGHTLKEKWHGSATQGGESM